MSLSKSLWLWGLCGIGAAGAIYWFNGGPGDSGPASSFARGDRERGVSERERRSRGWDEMDSSIPRSIRRNIERLRASGDPAKIAWARAEELSWTDFPQAAALARQLYPGKEGEDRVAQLLAMLHQFTLDGFAENLGEIRSDSQRATLASGIAGSWAKTQPVSLADYANENLSGNTRIAVLASIGESLRRAGRFDAAEEVLAKMPDTKERTDALSRLAAGKARSDLQGSVEWAMQLPRDEDSITAMRAIMGAGALTREQLLVIANESPHETLRGTAVRSLGKLLAGEDIETASAWAGELPESYRAPVQRQVAITLAQQDLTRGTEYLLSIEDESSRVSALDTIAGDAIRASPVNASRWLDTLPQELKERVAFTLAMQWHESDSAAAMRWVDGLPDGAVRDRALVAVSTRAASTDLAEARELASQISEESLREIMLEDYTPEPDSER